MAPPPASDAFTEPHLETSALLVIDMQADFLDDGPAAVAGTSAVLPELIGLVAAYRAAGRPIVHVVRLYQGDDVDLVRRAALRAGAPVVRPGSAGARVAPGLLPAPEVELDGEALLAGHLQRVGPGEVVLWKPRWSAFHRTPLDDHLRQLGVDTVVVAGCNFPNCPRATVFDASGRDYRVVVVPDATSQVTPERLADAEALGVHPVPAAEVVRAVAGPQRPAGAADRAVLSVPAARMAAVAAFFLPRASDDEQAERLYEALAEFAGCEPAPPGRRVHAIAFDQDGARWVAEVGAELRGERRTQQLRRGELLERTETLTSATRVLAVYPGTPYVVVTDAQPITGTPSEWANPFSARPDEVTLFDAP